MRLVQLKQGEKKGSRRHRLSLWGWAGGDLGDKGHLCSTGDAQGSLSLTVTTNQRAYTLSRGQAQPAANQTMPGQPSWHCRAAPATSPIAPPHSGTAPRATTSCLQPFHTLTYRYIHPHLHLAVSGARGVLVLVSHHNPGDGGGSTALLPGQQ